MSAAEFGRWIDYRQRHGPMNDERTADRPAALLATIANKAMGGKAQMMDFMPFTEAPEEPEVTRPEQLAGIFGGIKR